VFPVLPDELLDAESSLQRAGLESLMAPCAELPQGRAEAAAAQLRGKRDEDPPYVLSSQLMRWEVLAPRDLRWHE